MGAPKKIIRGPGHPPGIVPCHFAGDLPELRALASRLRPETYRVDVYHLGTRIDGGTAEGFPGCLALVRTFEARYPGKDVRPSHPDWADGDDGLTKAERDAVEEVRGG